MNTATLVERVWKRHSNPLSVWTRLLSYPIVFVPFWNRSWKQGVAVAAWFAANPVLFSEPENRGAWATRVVLGEKLWMAERPLDSSMLINVTSAALGAGGIWWAHKRRFWPMVFFVSAGFCCCCGALAGTHPTTITTTTRHATATAAKTRPIRHDSPSQAPVATALLPANRLLDSARSRLDLPIIGYQGVAVESSL